MSLEAHFDELLMRIAACEAHNAEAVQLLRRELAALRNDALQPTVERALRAAFALRTTLEALERAALGVPQYFSDETLSQAVERYGGFRPAARALGLSTHSTVIRAVQRLNAAAETDISNEG